MDRILEQLKLLSDNEYAAFQAKLTPGIDKDRFIGVRVPKVRTYAKELYKEGNYSGFLHELPHYYYDENMLHGVLISEIKDADVCFDEVSRFLPYVDNWAVCDIMSPKIFKKNKDRLLKEIDIWTKSKETYTIRFGLEMLMTHFLDDDFKAEYLEIPARIKSDEYYVNMMIAWFFATALAKRWEKAITYIEEGRLEKWTHNKSVQKALESYRISDEQKTYLRSLKK